MIRVAGRVSIVTPCLNGATYLERTIRSIRAQTYPDIEYIMVDGGSTDGSIEIARASAPNARVISLPGASQTRAINEGFARCSGEFFAFLNADDVLEDGAIAEGVRLLNSSHASFAYGGGTFVDEHDVELRDYHVCDVTAECLEHECCICQPATLIRATAFEHIGGIDEGYDMAFDYDLWFRLLREAPPVRSQSRWARARMHTNSKTSRDAKRMYAEVMRLLLRHRGYVPFSWAHAYADYVLNPRDQFFAPPTGSPQRSALTLLLGLYHNPRHPFAFTREFIQETVRLRKKSGSTA